MKMPPGHAPVLQRAIHDTAGMVAALRRFVRERENTAEYRRNRAYIAERMAGLDTAVRAGFGLARLDREIRDALAPGAIRYHMSNLAGNHSGLTDGDETLIQERIDAMNGGENRFNLHIGVGGLRTMDVTGTSFGGRGRGNVRLQFHGDGSMRLVDHDNRSLI